MMAASKDKPKKKSSVLKGCVMVPSYDRWSCHTCHPARAGCGSARPRYQPEFNSIHPIVLPTLIPVLSLIPYHKI